jgi:TRAP-type C4-dicarboxylate transport system permease small subunit
MGGVMENRKLGPLDWFAALMMLLIVLVVSGQIIFRYAFNSSLSWSEEISRYFFAWMIFVGATLAIKENNHIKVDLFYDMLGRHARKIVDIVLYSLIIFVQGYFLVFSIQFIIKTHGTYSTAMQLPMNMVVYPSITAGCAVSIWFCVRKLAGIGAGK